MGRPVESASHVAAGAIFEDQEAWAGADAVIAAAAGAPLVDRLGRLVCGVAPVD